MGRPSSRTGTPSVATYVAPDTAAGAERWDRWASQRRICIDEEQTRLLLGARRQRLCRIAAIHPLQPIVKLMSLIQDWLGCSD
jgi:hypothetical protein